MKPLGALWDEIRRPAPGLAAVPSPRWSRPWSAHPVSAARVYRAAQARQARTIVETGTFEGLGTWALALAAQSYGGARILTIDYDGDPDCDIPAAEWARLRVIRAENLDAARLACPDVEITFLDGDSREVLPGLVAGPAKGWELFFQDSMHFTAGIRAEWTIMEPAGARGAFAIFDDVCVDWRKLPSHLAGRRDFCLWFVLRQAIGRRWRWRSTGVGRGQLFAFRRDAWDA